MTFENKWRKYKPVPSLREHKCFGCSSCNPSGLQMKFFTDEKSVFSRLTVPQHLCGWDDLVHGGVISTILDEIMSWAAIYLLKKIILTKSMTVDFLKPVFIGDEIKAEGRVSELISQREVVMEAFIYDKEHKLCTKSKGTFALISRELAEKLGVMGEKALAELETVINR